MMMIKTEKKTCLTQPPNAHSCSAHTHTTHILFVVCGFKDFHIFSCNKYHRENIVNKKENNNNSYKVVQVKSRQ